MSSNFQVCGAATKYRQFVYNVGIAVKQPGYGVSSLAHISTCSAVWNRVRPRFFDQVGLETMYASSGNKYFFTKSCHCQT